ncbi:hypothetical protein AGMMS49921_11880 [Endomicrobiia bacterium]|nr:hypothetical protein AGMMS49921_11880 [Endomicrobiia bacterium]
MLEIIEMYENYGQEVTKKAYGADGKVVTMEEKVKRSQKAIFE